MDAVDQVVGVHDRIDVALGDRGLEGGQVDLAHGALVQVGADIVPAIFLAVDGVVLDGGDDALGLNALDKGHVETGVEERIFREVFEVAAGDGRTGDVDAGAEQEVHTACARVLAHALADAAGQLGVP